MPVRSNHRSTPKYRNLGWKYSVDPNSVICPIHGLQVYGPSTLSFSDAQEAQPTISALVEGVYLLN